MQSQKPMLKQNNHNFKWLPQTSGHCSLGTCVDALEPTPFRMLCTCGLQTQVLVIVFLHWKTKVNMTVLYKQILTVSSCFFLCVLPGGDRGHRSMTELGVHEIPCWNAARTHANLCFTFLACKMGHLTYLLVNICSFFSVYAVLSRKTDNAI